MTLRNAVFFSYARPADVEYAMEKALSDLFDENAAWDKQSSISITLLAFLNLGASG